MSYAACKTMRTVTYIRGICSGFVTIIFGIVRRIRSISIVPIDPMSRACRKRFSRLRAEGPLAPFLASYSESLADQGFSQVSFLKKTFLISEFSRWLNQKNITVCKITAEHQKAFLRHRGRNRCRKRGDAISHLEDMASWLREKGIVPRRDIDSADETQAHGLLREYSTYLQEERGLAATTIKQYLGSVRQFLNSLYRAGKVQLASLRAKQIVDFVRGRAPGDRTFSAAKNTTFALRSFLRFARYRDYIKTDLAAAVPAVAGWSMASIPRAMPLPCVHRVLKESKRWRTSKGLRDRAILLLLARLGLRAREIILLELGDIDWTEASLRIRGKSRDERPLPLPFEVGRAIATYLRKARPTAACRRVFLRTRAPVGGLESSGAICQIVCRSLKRAGIQPAYKGSHQFRHALASDMLRRGLSLTEIGQVLRHRSPNTTRRYAKVDLTALREVALPWPGGQS